MEIKNVLVFLILFTLSSFVAVCRPKYDHNKKPDHALNVRGNLPNFFGKSLRGDPVRVAYLGGSITAQNGWRAYSLEGFKQRYPKAVFTEINAAIGGTGSVFGVFRLNDHVLKFNPDLVFVEFAVNDDGAPTEKIMRSMEGIVRQIWQYNPRTDICFVYTIKESFLKTEQNGKLPASAVIMEKIAEKYHIPTINFGFEVSKMVDRKQLIFKGAEKELNGVKVFSPDGVHPYLETGHHIYQTVLDRSFDTMAAGKIPKRIKHLLSKPIAPDYFSNTKMVDIPDVKLSKNWKVFQIKDQPLFAGFGQYLEKLGKASQSGETLTIRFKGQAIGAYDIMGPDAGRIIIEIDGLVTDTISRFDAYCTYRRMNYFLIDHLENKDHKVVFRLLSEPFNKAAILAKNGNVIKNPDDYKENNWYVGKILIDGNLLP